MGPAVQRFEVTAIAVTIAGEQTCDLDAHVTTRRGQARDVLSVATGDLLVYCHDLAAVRAVAGAWQAALGYLPHDLPEALTILEPNRHRAAIVLRIGGAPDRQTVHGISAAASPNGRPVVRVGVGALTVHAHDRLAVTSSAAIWQQALTIARRLWPDPDAFDVAEARERELIARYGRATAGRSPR